MHKVALRLAVIACALPAHAAPIKLQCRILGSAAAIYGSLSVTVDPQALTVEVTAARDDGRTWRYRDGAYEPVQTRGESWQGLDDYFVAQFVRVDPRMVTFGFRDDDDPSSGVVGSFNRSALDHPGKPCLWHRTRLFDTG